VFLDSDSFVVVWLLRVLDLRMKDSDSGLSFLLGFRFLVFGVNGLVVGVYV
jgi:hypothetical protein